MTRGEARRRFEQLRGEGEPARADLRSLLRECEQAITAAAAGRSWKTDAAGAFADLLLAAALADLQPGASADSRRRLEAALLSGPRALTGLAGELDVRIEDADKFRRDMELLRARRRCQQLRLRCLEHLDAIFHCERAQP
jgi:hypothetical protein